MQIYTIGHSNHPKDTFLKLLLEKGIKQLVDVRSSPYSKYSPHFNREMLEFYLKKERITYFYSGKQLGGRPPDASCYKKRVLPPENVDYLHEVDYPEVMQKSWFLDGIDSLLKRAKSIPTVIMCSEEDPSLCHRHHMISKYLIDNIPDITVQHIRGDGNLVNAKSILASVNEKPSEQMSLFN